MKSLYFQLARIHHPTGGQTDYISTWEALSKDLLKHSNYGKYVNDAKKEAKKILPTLNLENKSEVEKIKAISDYVKYNFNWNGFFGIYSSQKVNNFLKTRIGNAADINLFLVGLLSEANINVSPVILSTRDHGKIDKSYPFLQYFNYTLAEVVSDNSKIFIDATEPMLPDRIVPSRCINTEGLKIEKQPSWTFIGQKSMSYIQKNLKINLISVNEVDVNASYGSVGQMAFIYRSKYLNKNENLIKYLKDSENINVDGDIQVTNFKELEKPFQVNFNFQTEVEGNDDKIFINPLLNLFSKDNLFKQTNRTLPVDLNELITKRFIIELNIPDGYEVEFIPEPLNINDDIMKISYLPEVNENKITIDATYGFTNYIYPAESYPKLKKNYGQMLSKFTEMIVFSKISDTE